MSILGKIVEDIVEPSLANALDKPIKLLDKAEKRLEEKSNKKEQEMFNSKDGEKILVFKQLPYSLKEKTYIFDAPKHIKYTITGDVMSLKRHLHISNNENKEVGYLKEKIMMIKPLITMDKNPSKFELIIEKEKVATLKSKSKLSKQIFIMDNGWKIEGNFLNSKYKIMSDKDEEIASVVYKPFYSMGDCYVISFSNQENELLILMTVLAIDVYNAPSKKSNFKKVAHEVKKDMWI